MSISEILHQNPLDTIGCGIGVLPPGGMGCVLARAGTGKTAFLVQMAFYDMFRGKNVLHLSLENPVQKVCLWYEEMFHEIVSRYGVSNPAALWTEILPHRFIFSFSADDAALARFEDKIEEMRSQNLFTPHAIVVDGFPFDAAHHALLKRIKAFAVKNGFYIWFSVRTHRHEQADAEGTPPQLQGIDDLFDAIFGLKSAEQAVQLFHIKGGNAAKKQHVLFLDPATMLVKKGR